jgi:hypothetical protein
LQVAENPASKWNGAHSDGRQIHGLKVSVFAQAKVTRSHRVGCANLSRFGMSATASRLRAMTIIKRKVTRNFTVIANDCFDDQSLTGEMLGMLTYLRSRPNNEWRAFRTTAGRLLKRRFRKIRKRPKE